MNQKQETIRTERTQLSHGRLIHVISVFPAAVQSTPEEKLKALIDMELRRESCVPKVLDIPAPLRYPVPAMLWAV